MHTLRYKTRADSAPKGKPRIYFCCHPEDFSIYFEPISRELLEIWDCAIWYDSASEASVHGQEDEESFADGLLQMQMFVIPVTESFLYETNDARIKEFSLAKEHHIPVLPILVNSGLAADFNRICGNIQFLDRTSTDVTEIPYMEKLKKFLESLLVSEELTQKVREAFDAYIFLSYRKKDRKYAQELMRLIHKHEFCRDIAIWYDEFLTPGENFNTSIQNALHNSQLFALAVTPNLVNEKNYVMDIEYPMAQKAGKKVLPAELCPTNQTLLKQHYAGIPDCIDGHDSERLSASLFDALNEIAIRENDSSPEHLFFIGLAYLGGIDVEVDTVRGVKLITEAAGKGLPQAMDKLVSLYHSGYGVSMDYDKAVFWQEKLVSCREEYFLETPREECAELLLISCMRLSELYMELQNYPLSAFVCQRFQTWMQRSKDYLSREASQRYTLWYYDKMGKICEEQGHLAEAKEKYLEHQHLSSQFMQEEKTIDSLYMVVISHDRLGDISMAEGNLEHARIHYEKAKHLLERADEQMQSVESKTKRLIMSMKYGRILLRQKNLSGALAQYEKILPLAEQLAKDSASSADMRVLSVCYQDMGDICSDIGQKQGAQEYFEKSLSIDEELVRKEPSLHNQRSLSVVYNRYGDILFNLNEITRKPSPEILEYYQKSLSMKKQLVKRTDSLQSWMDLAHTYDRISRFYNVNGQPQETMDFLFLAIDAAEHAVSHFGGVEAKRALSSYFSHLARNYSYKKDTRKERLYQQKSFELNQQIAEETQSLEDQVVLASDYQTMSFNANAEKDYETAEAYQIKCIELCERAVKMEPSVSRYRQNLSLYYGNMGHLCKRTGKPGEARIYYEKSLLLSRELTDEDISNLGQWGLAGIYRELADGYSEDGDWEKAQIYYQSYIDIYEKQAAQEPVRDNIERLKDAWAHRYARAKSCKQYEEAKACALRTSALANRSSEMEKDNIVAYDSALYRYRCLIEICLLQKDFGEAKHYAEIYHEMAKQMPGRFPVTSKFMGVSLNEYMGTRLRMLLQIYTECGDSYKKEEDYEHAKAAYQEAIYYAEEFVKAFPEDRNGRNRLALANYYYGDVMPDVYYMGYMREALKLWEKLAEEDPKTASYAHNADIVRKIVES